MVKVHTLGRRRLPNLLRNQLAQFRVDLDVGKLQFLVDSVNILTIDDHEDVPLGECSLRKVVLEAFIARAKRTLQPLLVF